MPQQQTLTYAAAFDARRQLLAARFLRLATILGIAPMSLGWLIVVLFIFTQSEMFVDAGILLLPIGALLVIAGLGMLGLWVSQERLLARATQRPFRWKTGIFTLLLLLSNFLSAYGCAVIGSFLVTNALTSYVMH